MNKKCAICNNTKFEKGMKKYCNKKCANIAYENYLIRIKEKSGAYAPNKIKCKLCGRWYKQVGSHIAQRHNMTCKEYREHFNLPLKKGILPNDLRAKKRKSVFENKTVDNLKRGIKTRYTKGDPRACVKYHWKGRSNQIHKIKDEYYN